MPFTSFKAAISIVLGGHTALGLTRVRVQRGGELVLAIMQYILSKEDHENYTISWRVEF